MLVIRSQAASKPKLASGRGFPNLVSFGGLRAVVALLHGTVKFYASPPPRGCQDAWSV